MNTNNTTNVLTQEEKDKMERKKMYEEQYKMIINTLERTINRYHTKKDPVIKSTLIVDKFHIFVDIVTTMLQIRMNEDQVDKDLQKKLIDIINTLHVDLDLLEEWIQAPIYSPDHPFLKIQLNNDIKELNDIKNKN